MSKQHNRNQKKSFPLGGRGSGRSIDYLDLNWLNASMMIRHMEANYKEGKPLTANRGKYEVIE